MIVETWKIKNKWSNDPKITYFEDIPLFLFYFKVCQSFHLQETFKVIYSQSKHSSLDGDKLINMMKNIIKSGISCTSM